MARPLRYLCCLPPNAGVVVAGLVAAAFNLTGCIYLALAAASWQNRIWPVWTKSIMLGLDVLAAAYGIVVAIIGLQRLTLKAVTVLERSARSYLGLAAGRSSLILVYLGIEYSKLPTACLAWQAAHANELKYDFNCTTYALWAVIVVAVVSFIDIGLALYFHGIALSMLREWTSAAPPRRPPKGSSAAEPQTTGGYGNIETAYPAVYQPHSGHAAPLADPYEERDISRGRLQAAYPATTASPHPSSSPAPPPPPKDAEDGDVTSGRRDVVGGVVAASPAPSSVLGPDAVGTVGLKPWVEGERPSSTASSAALSTGTDRPLLD